MLLNQIVAQLKNKGVVFDEGLSDEEIRDIEQENGFYFPPDLKSFLQYSLPISILKNGTHRNDFPNWRVDPISIMRKYQSSLLDGIVWQLENQDDYWLKRWGTRPSNLAQAIAIVEKDFALAPILIPIFSHRFIPSKPRSSGNPVFSVVGVDIIIYGSNLFHYLAKEFQLQTLMALASQPSPIEFWNDFLSENR